MTAPQPHADPIAVGSGKGGVGKSTVSANLASPSRAGKNVGLLDADIYGPSQPPCWASRATPTAEDEQLIPVEAWGMKLMSLGHRRAGHALSGAGRWRPAR